MSLLYVDCFAGAAGDMIVGALLDAGCDCDRLREELAKLPLSGYTLAAGKAKRKGLAGTKFHVQIEGEPAEGHEHAHEHHGHAHAPHDHGHEHHDHGHEHPDHHHGRHEHEHAVHEPHGHEHGAGPHEHRGLGDILRLIDAAGLPERAAERARRVFRRLAEAEARAHDIDVEQVHFHEVGAVDSIVDIVGACVAMELLGVDRVVCSPVPVGSGTIECAHGTMPAPAPATAILLDGASVRPAGVAREATTPTAAALLVELADSFGPLPEMRVRAVGYGAGSRTDGPVPNLLRVYLGEESDDGEADSVVELAANVDDCTGEVLGAVLEQLLAAGCLDAWAAPITMKRSRPGWMLCALASPADAPAAEEILFRETTTFGVRRQILTRGKLARSFDTVETPYGPVRIKVGRRGGQVLTASPEFSDCRDAAETHHTAVKSVMLAALSAWREAHS